MVCATAGMAFGGWLMRRLKSTPNETAWWTARIAVAASLCTAFVIVGCRTPDVAGVTEPYFGEADTGSVQVATACNNNGVWPPPTSTHCPAAFEPVCGANGLTFVNACFAGCNASDAPPYGECSCAGSAAASQPAATTAPGLCAQDCWGGTLPMFVAGVGILMFVTFMVKWRQCPCFSLPPCSHNVTRGHEQNNAPTSMGILRSVPHELRPMSMAAFVVGTKLLGNVPGPVILGALLV